MSHYKRSCFERSDHQIRVTVFCGLGEFKCKLALTSHVQEVSLLLCVMSYWTAPSQEELPLRQVATFPAGPPGAVSAPFLDFCFGHKQSNNVIQGIS